MSQVYHDTRRRFIKRLAAVAGGLCAYPHFSRGVEARVPKRSAKDVRIERVWHGFEEHAFRAPLKFAQAVVDRQTMLTVDCTVRTAAGKVATGFGTLPLNYVFTFPSKVLSEEARLGAMKSLAEELVKVTGDYREPGHPIDINGALAPAYSKAAADVSPR